MVAFEPAALVAPAARFADASGTDADAVWRLFRESGFLYPEKLRTLDTDAVRATLGALLARPNDVFRALILAGEGRIDAHVSALRSYPRTWSCQHLAARAFGKSTATRGLQISQAMAEQLDTLPACAFEWLRIWYQPGKRFAQRVYGDFAPRSRNSRLFQQTRYGYAVAETLVGSSNARPAPEVCVRATQACDATAVAALIAARSPALMLEADALACDELALVELDRRYRELGLGRSREVLIAERAGVALGCAVLEASSRGLNLSELTNSFRIFAASEDHTVTKALAHHARARYGELGAKHCVALSSPEQALALEDAGFCESRSYVCWTLHRSQLGAFHDHLRSLQ